MTGQKGEEHGGESLAERRNLILVSVTLSIFYLAGGRFSGFFNTPVGAVQIQNPAVLTAAGWITWLYAWWRFWLFYGGCRKSAFEIFKSHLIREIPRVPRFPDIQHSLTIDDVNPAARENAAANAQFVDGVIREQQFWLARDGTKFYLCWWRHNVNDTARRRMENWSLRRELGRWVAVRTICRAWWLAVFSGRDFSQRVLPHLIASTPPLALLANVMIYR